MKHSVEQAARLGQVGRRTAVLGTLAAVITLQADAALAHAMMRRAVPPVGGTINVAPGEVVLDFSEALEPRFSLIEVQDASGKRVDKGNIHSGANDPKRLVVDLPRLPPGNYKVVWRATSVDTHRTEGSYTFTIQH